MTTPRRSPRRFDLEVYPRLVASDNGPPSAAELWALHGRLILDAAGEGIYGLDVEGRSTFVNPAAARLTGHAIDELLGQRMHDVVHHSHADGSCYPNHECPIYAAFKDGVIRNACDDVFWRKDGTSFPVEYTSTPIYRGATLAGAVVVFRDISQRRRTEERLRTALRDVQRLEAQLRLENEGLRQQIESTRELSQLVGQNTGLRDTLRLVERVAATESTVLIQGETGTGKELIARAIHRLSPRRDAPFVKVNCAALSPQLVESELFGHEKGAFTGASQQRAGRFEQARGGSLLLDEVSELSLESQAKLLRVLQERELERVGGNTTLPVDARVIAATNQDLRALVRQGRFRSDLYFRLHVLPITLPRLAERRSDIPALAEHFLEQLEQRWGRRVGRLDERALARLLAYDWPGNVRELANVIERAALLSDGPSLEVPPELLAFGGDSPCAEPAAPVAAQAAPSPPPPARQASIATLADLERAHILRALEATRWRLAGREGAGALLGMHPNTLRHRMKKLHIER
ncbi:MAG TPA: sigma 54-interacting transcriptional regulator [Polyangiaceae bacterium]|nr:sigma 54-interacting transcriptional regulator [Polyangiaceae bacterium]